MSHPNIELVATIASLQAKNTRLMRLVEVAFTEGRHGYSTWMYSASKEQLEFEANHD